MHFNHSSPDLKTAQDIGLNKEEYDRIKKILDRPPNFTELSIFSVIWSKAYAAKHTQQWFRQAPRENKYILTDANKSHLDLVKIDKDLVCAFKIGFASLPSDQEVYQTTVNNISHLYKSILTSGSRPIAALHSLRFGKIDTKKTKAVMNEVADGITDYYNQLGTPVVGGDVYFYDHNEQNCQVNTLTVGIVKKEEITADIVFSSGDPVFMVGSATGKEGSSKTISLFTDPTSEHVDSVPTPSPKRLSFPEKLLSEAILEAAKTGAILCMHNIEMAGIAGAVANICTNHGIGMHIDLDQVVLKEAEMEAFEIALSESPERVLIIGGKDKGNLLLEIFHKWDLSIVQIGEVKDNSQLILYKNNEQVAEIPAQALTSVEHPVFNQNSRRPTGYFDKIKHFKTGKIKRPANYPQAAWKVFSSPNIASKKWIHELCVSKGQANSLKPKRTADAALIKIEESNQCLAIAVNGNPNYAAADPYIGSMIAVGEAARNIVCSGGKPIAVSVCMNFDNSQSQTVQWQFNQASKGINDACRKFGLPVVNSSLHFQDAPLDDNKTKPIDPAPTIGMIGLLNNYDANTSLHFKEEQHQIYMIGTPQNDLGCSEYLRVVHGIANSPAPAFDLDEEIHIQRNLKKIFKKGLIESAHDISEGGLFVCLIECAIPNNLGFDIEADGNFRKDAYLFGESQSRIVVTTQEQNEDELVNYLNSNNVPFTNLGQVVGKNAIIDKKDYGAISKWKAFYDNFIASTLKKD